MIYINQGRPLYKKVAFYMQNSPPSIQFDVQFMWVDEALLSFPFLVKDITELYSPLRNIIIYLLHAGKCSDALGF